MKGINLSGKVLFSLVFLPFLLFAPFREAASIDHATVVTTLDGKVLIKLEPHGSIRAKVFQGQILQYEFILDRESQQKLLTSNIDKANIYLIGKYGEELVIDDLKTQRRFVLSMFDQVSKFKTIPFARTKPTVIKGYSISLVK